MTYNSNRARSSPARALSGLFVRSLSARREAASTRSRRPSLLIKNDRYTVLFKWFAGRDPRAIHEELRARGLWEENAAVAPDQQRPVKPMAAAPAHQPDVAALALWRDGKAVSGTLAEQFLRARGLTIDPPPSLRPTTVLHLDRYPLPALVSAAAAPAPRSFIVNDGNHSLFEMLSPVGLVFARFDLI